MNFFDFLFPSSCSLCDGEISNGAVCQSCMKKLMLEIKPKSISFDVEGIRIEGRYIFDYDNEDVLKLLFALKENGNKGLFSFAAGLYRQTLPNNFEGVVTNVPRRKSNVRIYGYDHVKEPLKILCKNNVALTYEELLLRKGFSKNQKELDAKRRIANSTGKFAATKKDIQTNILLVDDVVTTGNTIVSCAKEILRVNPDAKLYFSFLTSRNSFSGI